VASAVACSPTSGAPTPSDLPVSDHATADQGSSSRHLLLRGARLPGGMQADVEIRDGRIVSVGPSAGNDNVVDVSGRYLAPAFIDSHVHLAYLPMTAEMLAGGIAAAVDLAAPEDFLSTDHGQMKLLASGPMITSPGGYPLDSWGQNGFGLGCSDPGACASAVDHLKSLGASLIKVPLTQPGLDDPSLQAVVDRAHVLGLRVAIHALSENAAHRGAIAGVDVLAHTPVEPLTEETLQTWSNRAVISTLAAFGGPDAIENASQLRARGGTLLYGTDFGNTMTTGIDIAEIDELTAAGFDGAAILDAGTRVPAAYWGLKDLGALEAGKSASILVLAEDPWLMPATLASPIADRAAFGS